MSRNLQECPVPNFRYLHGPPAILKLLILKWRDKETYENTCFNANISLVYLETLQENYAS